MFSTVIRDAILAVGFLGLVVGGTPTNVTTEGMTYTPYEGACIPANRANDWVGGMAPKGTHEGGKIISYRTETIRPDLCKKPGYLWAEGGEFWRP